MYNIHKPLQFNLVVIQTTNFLYKLNSPILGKEGAKVHRKYITEYKIKKLLTITLLVAKDSACLGNCQAQEAVIFSCNA